MGSTSHTSSGISLASIVGLPEGGLETLRNHDPYIALMRLASDQTGEGQIKLATWFRLSESKQTTSLSDDQKRRLILNATYATLTHGRIQAYCDLYEALGKKPATKSFFTPDDFRHAIGTSLISKDPATFARLKTLSADDASMQALFTAQDVRSAVQTALETVDSDAIVQLQNGFGNDPAFSYLIPVWTEYDRVHETTTALWKDGTLYVRTPQTEITSAPELRIKYKRDDSRLCDAWERTVAILKNLDVRGMNSWTECGINTPVNGEVRDGARKALGALTISPPHLGKPVPF
jgi:hypothetical protein